LAEKILEGWLFIINLSLGGFSQLFKGGGFLKILLRNMLSVGLVFLGGLSLISPLLMALCGAFYSLNLFCVEWSPLILPYVILLVSIEASFFLLTASVSSTLAGEAFRVKPSWRGLLKFWGNLKPLSPKRPSIGWMRVFSENRDMLNLWLITVSALLLSGALLESWLLACWA